MIFCLSRYLGFFLVALICGFSLILLLQLSSSLLGPSKSACTKKACLAKYMEGPPAFNNKELKNHLEKHYFVQPSSEPYALTGNSGIDSHFNNVANYVKEYFNGKKNGIFVVLGAGDGEYKDLTLLLEKELGWTGLLIEPHPILFKKLRSKNRKSILCRAAVSPFPYPAKIKIANMKVKAEDTEEEKEKKYRMAKVSQLLSEADSSELEEHQVQSIPLENLIYGAGISNKVDLMVLDMSGSDLDVILNTKFPAIPDIEMLVANANGNEMSDDIGSYFLDKNLVLKKVYGDSPLNSTFILAQFVNED